MSAGHTFYITTPIYYVNDVPHIGHAYTTVAADVLARYWRLRGRDVFFLTGLDEHGQKVQQAAAKAGIDPQAHCDRLAPQFTHLWQRLNISHNAFIRTTDRPHQSVVQRYLQQLYDKQLIYKADYTGWYCTFDERFWTEKDVADGLCPDCKRPIERLSEHNYFFRMGQYQDRLQRHILEHPDFIRPESRRNEVLGFLQTQTLGDLSISRPKSRLSWGIELPFDKDYVTYVWFDALVNYMSALEYLPQEQPAGLRYWPADVHLVGKDILTTHAVYWSTMLMALERPLPKTVFAHGWWTVDGEKMSKSRGNVVDPNKMVDQFGADAFRYFLLREVPFGQDGDFSESGMVKRMNSELADGLGNLLSRSLTMIERFAGGIIPPHDTISDGDLETDLMRRSGELFGEASDHIEHLRFSRALESISEIVQVCDQYIDKTAPWVLAKKPEHRPKLLNSLYHIAYTLGALVHPLYPFMPRTSATMATQLGLEPKEDGKALTYLDPHLLPGRTVKKGAALFPRIDTKPQGAKPVSETPAFPQPTAAATTGAPAASQSPAPTTTPAAAQPAQITIDDFMKIQLKTAKVLSAERVPKSEKLLKLQVSLGTELRQIVAGIGKKYEPDALVGKTIVIVANLKPAKLMGIESQGMVLAAGDSEVRGLATFVEDVEPGTKVK
ncbi:MAG: Methionine--tRNA ligase [Nitrospirae bacterium]|nr:Methionine--tRNA ligase [Nitrospirota bacterium]MEB2339964.1 methionine--tRNA ligase [Nitrospirales bacterium]